MEVRLLADQQTARREIVDDAAVGVLHEPAVPRPHARVERAVGVDGIENREVLALGDLHVVGAERRRDVHEPRALVGRHEVGQHDAARRLVEGDEVERAPVPDALEIGTVEAAEDLGPIGRALHCHHEVATAAVVGHPHVGDVGPGGHRDVRDERPGRRRPHEQVRVVVDDRKADVDGRVGDVLVPLCDLVRRQGGPAARAVRRHAVALVEQAFVPQLPDEPPDRLDVVVAQRPVGILGVDPHRGTLGEAGEVLDVALHGFAAPLVECLDPVSLDVALAAESELLLDFDLDGEAVAVPAALPRDVEPLHGLEAREQVLEDAGPDVVEAGPPVGGGWPLVEHPPRPPGPAAPHLREQVRGAPAGQDALFERDEVQLRVHGTEGHPHTIGGP